jgi:hypothetical protein
MIDISRRGADVVTGVPTNRPYRGILFNVAAAAFHKIARAMVPVDLPRDPNTMFRVFSRRAVNAITRVVRKRRFLVVLVSEIGYQSATFPYALIHRSGPPHGLKLMEALSLGISVIVHNSNVPLRLVSVVGISGSLLSALYALYVIVVNFIKKQVMEGWTTLSLQISGLFLLVFIGFTLFGIYMERILEEATDQPLYNVVDELHSSVMMADQTRRNILERSDHVSPEESAKS